MYQAEQVMSGGSTRDNLKYEIFSSHDWTVAQYMLFVDATNGNFTNLPFASQIVFELHSSDDCHTENCFWVEVWYNNIAQRFDGMCSDPTKCVWNEWLWVLKQKGFVSSTTGYVEECATPWTPPTHEVSERRRR